MSFSALNMERKVIWWKTLLEVRNLEVKPFATGRDGFSPDRRRRETIKLYAS